MENNQTNQPWSYTSPAAPVIPAAPAVVPPVVNHLYPSGRREGIFAILAIFSGLILCNFTLVGGFNLGFAIAYCVMVLSSAGYLLVGGGRLTFYSAALLLLSCVMAAGYARSDDGFVKFILMGFLFLAENLGLCLMAKQNRRPAGGLTSTLDAFRTAFMLGMGRMGPSLGGLFGSLRKGGPGSKKGVAVLIGAAVALPVVAVLISLLISADAAFAGLLRYLPEIGLFQILVTIFFGVGLACILYTRAAALRHDDKAPVRPVNIKTISHLTVNTVLVAVVLVYLVYLLSQLAYFVGGFSGILPEEYTMAQYARRGFFEMALLCAIDLGVIALAMGFVRKKNGKAPLFTRLLCLFIGLVTVFFVAAASAKMFLYIGSFGLTRLRVLTEVIMVFLGLSTVVLCAWLFLPKLPYLKMVLVLGMITGSAVIWVDVDTLVARYNVSAYQSGRLEQIDLNYLESLGNSAVPEIARLLDDEDPAIAKRAKEILAWCYDPCEDFRDWNYVTGQAGKVMEERDIPWWGDEDFKYQDIYDEI